LRCFFSAIPPTSGADEEEEEEEAEEEEEEEDEEDEEDDEDGSRGGSSFVSILPSCFHYFTKNRLGKKGFIKKIQFSRIHVSTTYLTLSEAPSKSC
jgi:hypothetical protein